MGSELWTLGLYFSFIKKVQKLPLNLYYWTEIRVDNDDSFYEFVLSNFCKTCHKRDVSAMGGMAAQIPVKHDENTNEAALQKYVQINETRNAKNGHDGTWAVASGFSKCCQRSFRCGMLTPNPD